MADDAPNTADQAPSKKRPKKPGKKPKGAALPGGVSPTTGRPRGAPRGKNDPTIPWDQIEREYVWGDTLRQNPDGTFVRKYPTFKALGEKFKVAPSLVHYYAKKGGWQDRRLRCISMTREEYDREVAKSRARRIVDAERLLEDWLGKFAEKLESGAVRADSVSDLNTVVRLQKFLKGEAESRTEQKTTLSLDQLTARHKATRVQLVEADGEVAGELAPEADEAAALAGADEALEGRGREAPPASEG